MSVIPSISPECASILESNESLLVNIIDLSCAQSHCELTEYQQSRIHITQQLLSDGVPLSFVSHPINRQFVTDINTMFSKLPRFVNFRKHKLTIPTFTEIEELPTDSADILKLIRKTNVELVGFYCNHKTIDKAFNNFDSLILGVYGSKEFEQFNQIVRRYADFIHNVKCRDNFGVPITQWYDPSENPDYVPDPADDPTFHINISRDSLDLFNLIAIINKKIISVNATIIDSCSKCNAAIRKHNYIVTLIDRMRNNKQLALDSLQTTITPETSTDQAFNKFIIDHFTNFDRISLSVLRKDYKSTFGTNITIDELRSKLEATGKFNIVNCSRTLFATLKK